MSKVNKKLNTLPLVSVVMPNYNNKDYLPLAVESILNQTYSNLELIIVDGHSTDGSIEIIESYISKDKRVKLIYDNGKGVGAATIIGCNEAKGEFIARMDSDDISNLDRIEREVSFLMANPEYVLVASAMEYIDEDGNYIGRDFTLTNEKVIKKVIKKRNVINQPMAMFRMDAYKKSGGYVPLIFVEDRVFWCRLSKYGKIKNFSFTLGKYRILGNSLCHTYNPYENVLLELRNKMVADNDILPSDVELYNSICIYSKKYRKTIQNLGKNRKKSREEIVYSFIKPFVGNKNAEYIISCLLNLRFNFIYD